MLCCSVIYYDVAPTGGQSLAKDEKKTAWRVRGRAACGVYRSRIAMVNGVGDEVFFRGSRFPLAS